MKKILSVLGLIACLSACTHNKVPVIDYMFVDDYDSYKIIDYTNLDEYFDIQSVSCELTENILSISIELEKNENRFNCETSKLKFFKATNLMSYLNKYRYTFNVEICDSEEDEIKSKTKFLNAEQLFGKELKKGDTFTLKCETKIKGSDKKIELLKKDGIYVVLYGLVNESNKQSDNEDYEDSDDDDESFI
ncbi:hypothetical protein [Bacteroides xylanisolvens]|uniref:hypothetical protein n=1 Tax=Bacteroides xylanisolvens TaxID=371601 RepID=UPI0022E42010|nr:hypothetical protein [Bacteroides xylanisolvens]